MLEHDASLAHDDAYFGPSYITNQTMLSEFIATSADGEYLTLEEIGKWRRHQQDYSAMNNPQYSLSFKPQAIAFLEASTLIAVFGTNGKVPVDWIKTWIGSEKLPKDFKPRSEKNLAGIFEFARIAAAMKWHAGIF
jgi:Peroxidase, family 2